MDPWQVLLGTGFMPHGHCYLWRTDLVLLHGLSDAAIALSYFTIPLTMTWIARRRRDVPYRGLFLAFVVFILSCGLGHAAEVFTLWTPIYWTSGLLKAATAAASALTAVALVRAAPAAVRLPGPDDLHEINARLRASERRFRAAASGSLDAFLMARLDGPVWRIVFVNQEASALLRADADADALGADLLVALGGEQGHAELAERMARVQRTGEAERFETRARPAGGATVDLQGQIVPLDDGICLTLRDVTRERAEGALRRYLADVVRSSRDAIMTLDLHARIQSWNQGAANLFGYDEEQALTLRSEALVPPEQVAAARDALDRALAGEAIPPLETERLHRDGRRLPVSIQLSPVRDADHRVIAVSKIVRDLSESRQARQLREALAEREVLMREIHHRVKNDLQLTVSLLRLAALESDHPEVQDALHEGASRLRAIAMVHEHLYKADSLKRLDLGAYLRDLTHAILRFAGHRGTIDLEAATIRTGVDVAVPCGLILHELLINAMKHGPGDDGATRLQVRLTATEDAVELAVLDNGAAWPEDLDPANSRGLGMRVIHTLVQQLGATLRLEDPPDKAARIRIPWAGGSPS